MKNRQLLLISSVALGIIASLVPTELKKANAIEARYSTNPDTYYNSITATGGTALLGQLHDLLCTTHQHYSTYDDCKNPEVIYSIEPGSKSEYITDFYSQHDIEKEWYTKVGGWNREHVWCQSLSIDIDTNVQLWGTKGGGSDLHHVRPIEYTSNSARNNHPYGLVKSNYTTVYPKDRSNNFLNYSSGKLDTKLDIFEPNDNVKGDVARILFYVYTHYSDYRLIQGTTNGTGCTTYGHLDITNIITTEEKTETAAWSLLLSWNQQDPVDNKERTRNNAVAQYQGNRNPFIDNPNYANQIWGTQTQSNVDRLDVQKLPNSESYSAWTDVSLNTKAIYAGYSLNNHQNAYIQVNKSKNSCIYTTKSGGFLKEIRYKLNKESISPTPLEVFVSNEPYSIELGSSLSDTNLGTRLGNMENIVGKEMTLIPDLETWKYVCVKSIENAAYFDYIEFEWEDFNIDDICSTPQTMTGLSLAYDDNEINEPSFVKVTENQDDFSGKYLIVSSYVDACLAKNDAGEIDYAGNNAEVEINNDAIPYEDAKDYEVVIKKNGSKYSIQLGENGNYIGNNTTNNLLDKSSSNIFALDISINADGTAQIMCSKDGNKSVLRYNAASNNNRFRFFKYATYEDQKPIYLYKYDADYSTKEALVSNVSMTFGALISYEEYQNILSSSNVTGYGVFATYKSNLKGKSIEELYNESDESVNSVEWLENNHIVYNARVICSESELPCNRTDSTGIPKLDNGQYVTWKLKINVKDTSYTTKISAVSYMIIDGEYCFFKQREASVSSLCTAYLNEENQYDESLLNSLSYLARLDGNII